MVIKKIPRPLNLEQLEPRCLLSTIVEGVEPDGDIYQIILTGPGNILDPALDNLTLSETTIRSKLKVIVLDPLGDGRVDVGNIDTLLSNIGRIEVQGDLGSLKVARIRQLKAQTLGAVEGPTHIFDINASIAQISIANGIFDSIIDVEGTLGKLQVGQKNDPASNISNSVFNIGDALNNVLLKQSLTANSIFKVEGHIGKIIIDKYLVGSTIEAGKNIAKLFVGASVINQSTIHIEGNLNFLKIKKSFTESTLNIGGHLGKGNFDNDVFDATFLIDSVGKIKVKDDLMNTRITITSDLTKLQTGDARNLSLRIAGSLGNLTVKRSLDASLISVLNDIGTIRVGGDLNHTNLIGGIDVGGDFLLGTADDVKSGETMIHNIFVRGDMIDSSIAAGINPNGLYFGDGDDTAINNHLGTARIERVIIKGEIINTGLLGESYALTADDGIDLILSQGKEFTGSPGVIVSSG